MTSNAHLRSSVLIPTADWSSAAPSPLEVALIVTRILTIQAPGTGSRPPAALLVDIHWRRIPCSPPARVILMIVIRGPVRAPMVPSLWIPCSAPRFWSVRRAQLAVALWWLGLTTGVLGSRSQPWTCCNSFTALVMCGQSFRPKEIKHVNY
jgi:hypothetical protein